MSLGLFSSAGIDTGSMLLLKTISKECDLDKIQRVLDVGCGVGPLGLAIASRCPHATITLVDKDKLAIEFSTHNAHLNALKNVKTAQRLMLEGPHEAGYDLIVSNFPAKAGIPILTDFIHRASRLLNPGGRIALVVVNTLNNICRTLIIGDGQIILHEDASKQHTVFHYRATAASTPHISETELLTPYIRFSGSFTVKRTHYTLDTVWNISDFDSLSWRIKLLGYLLEMQSYKGTMVFWSPGQGHFPLLCVCRHGARPEKLILAGHDRLALLVSQRNLKAAGNFPMAEILQLSEPGYLIDSIPRESTDLLLTDINPVPRSQWSTRLKKAASVIIKPGGTWAMIGRSTNIAEVMKRTKGWTPLADKRHHGWRAVILRRAAYK